MADAYTGTSALSNTIQAAVDQYVRAELRHMPLLRSLADTRPVQVDKPGSSVALYIRSDLSPATTPLNELSDPDAVALPNPTSITLTPNEYGNVTLASLKANATSFMDVDADQRDSIVWNMRDTLDVLVGNILKGATNVRFSGDATTTNTVDATDVITANDIRYTVTKLRANAAQPRIGELYSAHIHPDVSADLRASTGAGSWQDLHKYAAPASFWPGTVGVFEGAFFVETARVPNAAEGASSAQVFRTFISGREALAEGVVVEPEVRIGVVPDKLNRFFPMGWYGFLGWSLFRQKAIYQIESGSAYAA